MTVSSSNEHVVSRALTMTHNYLNSQKSSPKMFQRQAKNLPEHISLSEKTSSGNELQRI